MGFQFIIPTEVNESVVKVYTSEKKNEHITRIHFTMNGQQTFTDYDEQFVSDKINNGFWKVVEL